MKVARIRRWSQGIFLTLFVLLIVRTEFRHSLAGAGGEIRLGWPASVFLEIDPLNAVLNALAAHRLERAMLWALVVLIPTFFLGRFFCGWVCPLGTLNQWVSSLGWGRNRGRARLDANRYHGWQRVKYYVLLATLAAALFGTAIGALLDPISLLVRSFVLAVLPAANYAANAAIAHLPMLPATVLHFVLKDTLLTFRQPQFEQGVAFGLILLAVLAANLFVTRLWCRLVCPLGALLGLVSRWSLITLKKPEHECGECNLCALDCQGGDDPAPGLRWRKAECHLCMNCTAGCKEGELKFALAAAPAVVVEKPDLKRRAAMASLVGGAVAVPALRAGEAPTPRAVRPPGAHEEHAFLERCIRCGECMKVCPTNALQPAALEAGLEGLWTPVLVARVGYCEPSCTLCGEVCPTGAIARIDSAQKGWVKGRGTPVRIGTAFYDRGRCLPWAMATECIVCEEWCPTSPKAIYLKAAEGSTIRQPYVDPARCVGCGACEYACPLRDRPAIYVTSAGESRSAASQFLLKSPAPVTLLPESAGAWTRTSAVRVFTPDTLWQYIDGGADRYVTAGLERTETASYRWQNKVDARVDVYVMKSAEAARRLYESEPAVGAREATVGDAARLYSAALTFRTGRALVRVTAFAYAGDALVVLGRAVERGARMTGR